MSSGDKAVSYSGLELGGKILAISGSIYGLGLVIINLSYFLWGFHDLEISNSKAIYAGIWTLMFFTGACLPAALLKEMHLEWSFHGRWKWPLAIGLIGLASIIFLAHLHRENIEGFIQNHHVGVFILLLSTESVGIGSCILTFLPETKNLLLSCNEEDLAKRIVGSVSTMFFGVVLLFLFAAFYTTIPEALGGGKPEQRDIWVSNEALAVFDYCKQPLRKEAPHGDNVTLLHDLWVLHETKDDLIIWRASCPTISLPRSWIKFSQWPQPQPN